jgi:pyroglutamyl-peptidase
MPLLRELLVKTSSNTNDGAAKILVTGFLPFRNEKINPSERLLTALNSEASSSPISQIHQMQTLPLETLLLPVNYQDSVVRLREHLHVHGPYRALLMLGQAGGRKAIRLERVALNWSETSFADEDGNLLPPGPLVTGAPAAYVADFFPASWKTELNEIAPTEISFSAGTYVCNSLYYSAMHLVAAQKTPALFVHVPYLPEQTLNKPEQPSMDFALQLKTVRRLLQLMSA